MSVVVARRGRGAPVSCRAMVVSVFVCLAVQSRSGGRIFEVRAKIVGGVGSWKWRVGIGKGREEGVQ